DRHHTVTGRESRGALAERLHLAGQLHTRNVLGRAGGRRVETAALHHVGPVEPGGAHLHEHLFGAGHGVGVLLYEDLPVADRGGLHRPRSLPIKPSSGPRVKQIKDAARVACSARERARTQVCAGPLPARAGPRTRCGESAETCPPGAPSPGASPPRTAGRHWGRRWWDCTTRT